MSIPYKNCFVPYCKNTTVTTPSKKFVTVPGAEVRRKLWFEAVRREYKKTKTRYSCCEDHFDFETDMENYLIHSKMGGKIILKPSVVPHVFNWPDFYSVKKQKIDEFVLTEDSYGYDFGTQNSLGMINTYQQTSPLKVKSVGVNCNLDTTDLTITKEEITETVSSSSDSVSPEMCDTASGSNKLANKGKTKNSPKISEDELILRRKRQTARRVRAYRERKKALGLQSSSQAELKSELLEKIRPITDATWNTSSASPGFVQSGEPVSENIVDEKILHQKQLNAERCRRYRQKCKRLKSSAGSNRGMSDSDTSTSRDTSFPANEESRKTWNIVCNINETNTFQIKDPRICQSHFNEGSLDSEKSPIEVYLKKGTIPNNNSLPSNIVGDGSNLEILPYMDSSEDQDEHLVMELKQEPDDFFIEEEKFETEDHFFPNNIEETFNNENNYNQICTEIKKEFVTIKQENDTQETQNIFKEKINIKQEVLEEETLNHQSNVIGRIDNVGSIKQEINVDSKTNLILEKRM